jgi:hypothetical protein
VTYAIDDPRSTDVINRVVGPSGSLSQLWKLNDPGTLTLCGYLQRVDTGARLAATGPVPLTYRSGRASVAIQVPPRVSPGQVFTMSLPVSAELRRQVEVTLKPAGTRGCGASYPFDAPVSVDVFDLWMQGNQSYAPAIQAPSVNGTYLLCAYVSEGPTDPAPEATATATFQVGPDLCAAARTQLLAANRAVGAAQRSVAKYRAAYRRDLRRLESTHDRRYRRLARHNLGRYQRALRRRAAARQAAASAQTAMTAACGGA